ncbi:MAG: hypothetical protein ABSG03_30465 [Bryobacteraceae bacterium]
MATQCEIVKETAAQIQPAGYELIRQAAEGGVMHNDDTPCACCPWTVARRLVWRTVDEPLFHLLRRATRIRRADR